MAGTPELKVYRGRAYVAACKFAEDAAMLMHGTGDRILLDHKLPLWEEGLESQPASESYDHVAEVVDRRIEILRAKRKEMPYRESRDVVAAAKKSPDW